MKSLPKTEDPLVVRTDFSDKSAWERVCRAVRKPYGKLGASVEFVDDTAFEGMTKEYVLSLSSKGHPHSFIILADQISVSMSDLPLLIVDLYDVPGREFRAIPSQIRGIEANLRLANMSFYEFAARVDQDGIFRGFSIPWFIRWFMKVIGLDGRGRRPTQRAPDVWESAAFWAYPTPKRYPALKPSPSPPASR